MRLKIFFRFLLSLYIVNCTLYIDAQAAAPTSDYTQQTDTNKTKPVQIRRGIELKEGYQSYEQYYSGKDMAEEKRSHFPLTGTGTWTELNPKVPRVTYIGLDFINPDTGWACGGSGAIIKTTNGGDDWTISETPVTNLLLKIHSYNGQVVICTGYDGLILRSSDGGETFEQIVSGVGSGTDLWGVQMVNDTLGWVCGMNQTLLKTTDAGLSWQQVFPGLNQHYWSLNFLDESYGMIACGGGIVLKTTDEGNNWTQTQAGDIRALYSIDIIDSLHIAAAGYEGKNVYSSDGGVSWISNPDLIAFTATNWIDFIDADTGYSVQDVYQIRKTTNRGQSWFNPNTANWGGEWHLQLLDDGTGYSCGEEIGGPYALNFYKRTNGLDNWSRLFLNDNFFDVYFITETKGFALSGSLYKTIDGGINWDKVENDVGGPGGYDILFIDSLTGFVANNNSAIFKTTDGGVSWYLTNTGGQVGDVRKIFFINSTTGWAATIWSPVSNGKILKTTDSGENWFVQAVQPSIDSYTSIFFVDSLNGWATSRYIWQTTDGGVNWVERTYLPSDSHDDVYFTNKDTGWISDYTIINTSLFKTIDGGETWLDIDEVIGARKFYFFPDPIHWIILGFSRYYITNDGGNSWLEFTNDVPSGLSSFQAPTNNFGLAVGSAGLILRYDDTSYVPVELTSLSATSEKGSVKLKWTTASETNNLGFEILRSTDNKNWDIVGFITGNGTTTILHTYQYTDEVKIAGNYYYKLKQVDYNGEFDFSNTIEAQVVQPIDFILYQNYPNPFNPITKITFEIPFQTEVRITLYDVTGEEIKILTNQKYEAGFHSVVINADDLSSGVYLYRMTTLSGYTAVKKLTIIK